VVYVLPYVAVCSHGIWTFPGRGDGSYGMRLGSIKRIARVWLSSSYSLPRGVLIKWRFLQGEKKLCVYGRTAGQQASISPYGLTPSSPA